MTDMVKRVHLIISQPISVANPFKYSYAFDTDMTTGDMNERNQIL